MNDLPVKFDDDGLVPVVIQDDSTGAVLMLAYMNEEALRTTRDTGKTHFWSRSRGKLWMKGETSGHVQLVTSIHVNCYENSLLIKVRQIGAACHTGFPTCYYRELAADNELVEIETRQFDPDAVYGLDEDRAVTAWLGAYQWLAENDMHNVSETSRRLHEDDVSSLVRRLSDELGELLGVLDGTHAHRERSADILLEGSQVLYWAVLAAIRGGSSVDDLSIAFRMPDEAADSARCSDVTRAIADFRTGLADEACVAIQTAIPEIVRLVSDAARVNGLSLVDVIRADLQDLRSREYLQNYFAHLHP